MSQLDCPSESAGHGGERVECTPPLDEGAVGAGEGVGRHSLEGHRGGRFGSGRVVTAEQDVVPTRRVIEDRVSAVADGAVSKCIVRR